MQLSAQDPQELDQKDQIGQRYRTSVVSLETHHTPVRNSRRKPQILQPGGGANRADLGTGKALLQWRTEAVAGACAHGVVIAASVNAQGEGGHGKPSGFRSGKEAGERPVVIQGDQIGDDLLGMGRQTPDQEPVSMETAPKRAEPARTVGWGVIEIEKRWRTGPEQRGKGANAESDAGHVVERAELWQSRVMATINADGLHNPSNKDGKTAWAIMEQECQKI